MTLQPCCESVHRPSYADGVAKAGAATNGCDGGGHEEDLGVAVTLFGVTLPGENRGAMAGKWYDSKVGDWG